MEETACCIIKLYWLGHSVVIHFKTMNYVFIVHFSSDLLAEFCELNFSSPQTFFYVICYLNAENKKFTISQEVKNFLKI